LAATSTEHDCVARDRYAVLLRLSTATPPLDEMWQAWHTIIAAVDPFLDTLTTADLFQDRTSKIDNDSFVTNAGNLMQRVIYHYWYHNGENQAIRQLLRHEGLQDFVGNIDEEAPYRG
jgi:hypothetical protein